MRVLLASLLLLLSANARADSQQPILLWGFQRGCTQLVDAAREVQQHLENTVVKPVDYLAPDASLLGCQGASCAAFVERTCQGSQRRIIGGFVDQNASKTLNRVRLWMHDPRTGQTAYHDNYCQNCDITGTLKVNAAEIAQAPRFQTAPGATPLYCQGDSPQAELPPRSGRIHWVVYGKDPHKPLITAAVRKLIQQAGADVPFQHEGKEYTLPVLKKVIAKEPGAQVFGVDIQASGVIELFLFDGPTELTEVQKVECPACDKEGLIEKVKQTTLNLLAHCFGESCARVGRSRAPAEACRPFEIPRCGDEPLPLAPTDGTTSATPDKPMGPEISPRMAKITKGALWGLFAVGAATTAVLIGLNETSVGTVNLNGDMYRHSLTPAAAGSGILTGIALGVAIPITLLVNRASSPPAATVPTASKTTASTFLRLQCPN